MKAIPKVNSKLGLDLRLQNESLKVKGAVNFSTLG